MKTRIIMGLVPAFAIALTAAACGSGGSGGSGGAGGGTPASSSHGNGGSGGGASPCGTLIWSSTNAACSSCMETSCCDQLAACDAGTKCGTLIACVRNCDPSDDTCVSTCQSTHADGQADVDALLGCYDTNCKNTSACGTKVCDTGVSVPDAACGDCLTTSCCDAWKLCSQDSACLDCLLNPTSACSSNPLYQDALTCQDGSCGTLCATRICDTTLGYPDAPACNYCLGHTDAMGGCCEETQACAADQTCLDCITGKTTTGCSGNTAYTGFNACQKAKCATECGTGG